MYVRQMQKHDEDWLLKIIGEYNLNEPSFRSRDYVKVIDSDVGGEPCGIGRLYHYTYDDRNYVKFAQILVFDGYNETQVLARIYKALFEKALDYGASNAYVVAEELPEVPFDFEECDPECEEVLVDEGYDYPSSPRLFRADVFEALDEKTEEEQLSELAEEFGYDDDTTTKYSL